MIFSNVLINEEQKIQSCLTRVSSKPMRLEKPTEQRMSAMFDDMREVNGRPKRRELGSSSTGKRPARD